MKNSIQFFLFVILATLISCNPIKKEWTTTKEMNTIEAYQAFINDHPDSEYNADAQIAIDSLYYVVEIINLKEHIKYYLNGDAKNNSIDRFLGRNFSERDQDQSSGTSYFGASNMLMSSTVSFSNSDQKLNIVYEPTSNQLIAKIEEIEYENGMEVLFKNGHKYIYESFSWKRVKNKPH